jgi:hypothetical protein
MINEIRPVNPGIIEFLLVDLDVALTFMDVAETTEFRETAERNHKNARKAYDMVVSKLGEVRPTEAQQSALEHKLALLRARLQDVGQL